MDFPKCLTDRVRGGSETLDFPKSLTDRSYSQLQIGFRVAQHLEILSKKRLDLYQAYQDSHEIDRLLLGTNRKIILRFGATLSAIGCTSS